jgi:hypothetical protein
LIWVILILIWGIFEFLGFFGSGGSPESGIHGG